MSVAKRMATSKVIDQSYLVHSMVRSNYIILKVWYNSGINDILIIGYKPFFHFSFKRFLCSTFFYVIW